MGSMKKGFEGMLGSKKVSGMAMRVRVGKMRLSLGPLMGFDWRWVMAVGI